MEHSVSERGGKDLPASPPDPNLLQSPCPTDSLCPTDSCYLALVTDLSINSPSPQLRKFTHKHQHPEFFLEEVGSSLSLLPSVSYLHAAPGTLCPGTVPSWEAEPVPRPGAAQPRDALSQPALQAEHVIKSQPVRCSSSAPEPLCKAIWSHVPNCRAPQPGSLAFLKVL